jgi:hypothetical protein
VEAFFNPDAVRFNKQIRNLDSGKWRQKSVGRRASSGLKAEICAASLGSWISQGAKR